MKSIFLAAALVCTGTATLADNHYSQLFHDAGTAGVIAELGSLSTPSPSDRLALGGAHFFTAIEGTLQTRYDYGLDTLDIAQDMGIPFLRLPSAPNPNPQPFDAAVFNQIFNDALADLSDAHSELNQIENSDTANVVLNVGDLWLDANANGQRDAGEDLDAIVKGQFAFYTYDTPAKLPVIRFDTSDAAWLAAYTQMLSGTLELILATDPSAAIDEVYSGAAVIDELNTSRQPAFTFLSGDDRPMFDAITAFLAAIEGEVDAERTRSAHRHFLTALDHNRIFWSRLASETDNKLEFIPNDTQTSALPIPFPPGIGKSWQAVLDDVEAVLKGDLLIPHWRLGTEAGLNLAEIFENPPVVDMIGIFQGYSVAAYAERGPLISLQNIESFDQLTQGNSPLFAVILN